MTTPHPLNPRVFDRSRPVVRRPVELATHLGLKTYNRTFARIEAALFLAEVIAHLQGSASRDYAGEIAQVNAAIANELDRLSAFATGESRRLDKTARQAPAASGEVSTIGYTQPACVELTMRTPQMRRYADLLVAVEGASRALDRAWYAGVVPTRARLDLENLLFRHCARACGAIERLARGLARRVRDDAEMPGYRDMLVKRTGRAPGAANPPAVEAEEREQMTAEEAASLQATEVLAHSLMAAAPVPAAEPAVEATAAAPMSGAYPVAAGAPEETAAPAAPTEGAGAEPRGGEMGDDWPAAALETAPVEAGVAEEAAKPRRRSIRDLVRGGEA